VITVCYALIAFSLEIKNLPLLALVSLVAGFADADIVTAQSAIADVSTKENRGRLFGYIYLSVSCAYVVGPLFGGKLADPSIVPWFSYSTPYWAVFILLIPTLAMTFMFFRETRPRETGTEVSYFKAFTNLTTVFTAKRIRIIYLVNFLIYFSIFGFFRSYPMYLVDEFKMDVGRVSEFIAWVAVPIILANLWITGFLSRHYTPRRITIVSTILFGLFTSVIIIPRAEDALWITLFLASLPLAVALPACASMLSLMVSADEQGGVLGNNQSLQVGAEAFSGFAAGLLAAVFFQLPIIVLSIIAVLAALILIVSGSGKPGSR
jgi:DHA1 family tetracycline resistance protein-like MFS transporter